MAKLGGGGREEPWLANSEAGCTANTGKTCRQRRPETAQAPWHYLSWPLTSLRPLRLEEASFVVLFPGLCCSHLSPETWLPLEARGYSS